MKEEKIIKHIGKVEGEILLFGGVYSNLQALTALKNWAEENNFLPRNIFCTGDILGYCAQPVECINLIQKWNINSIAGNVEIQVRNNETDCNCKFTTGGRCDLLSRNWYNYILDKIDTSSKQWLHTLPHHLQFSYGKDRITVLHGSWFQTSEFIFKSTDWCVKEKNFDQSDSTIIIAGHCGLPFIHHQDEFTWLNPGVIGMPANDGSPKVWFAIGKMKDARFMCEFRQLEYDYNTTAYLMNKNNLPPTYAETLVTGIWDNCEILPEEETEKQGQQIVL